jgi:transposase-like protein
MVDHMVEISRPRGRVDVQVGAGRRRRWSGEAKGRIVAESYAPGAVVSEVARRHDISAQHLFAWRKAARRGLLSLPADEAPLRGAFVADNFVCVPERVRLAATGARDRNVELTPLLSSVVFCRPKFPSRATISWQSGRLLGLDRELYQRGPAIRPRTIHKRCGGRRAHSSSLHGGHSMRRASRPAGRGRPYQSRCPQKIGAIVASGPVQLGVHSVASERASPARIRPALVVCSRAGGGASVHGRAPWCR